MSERSRPVSILLVDDEPANLTALEVVLAPLGQRLVTAGSGREALRHLLREDFAVIVLDVRMPDMDGFETAELIRSRPASRTTPIIFVTAFPEAERDLERAYRIGAVDILFKPFMPEFLRSKVRVFVDLHQKQRSIAELLAKAQESNRAKSEFLNLAAHELRTPLAVIVGYLSMLADGTFGEVSAELRQAFEILNEKGEELNRIVDDLLTASRLESGVLPRRLVECDLREIAKQAVRAARPQAELLSAELHLDVPEQPVIVRADPIYLARIVDNLVINALAYSEGYPWVRITVRGDEEAVLTVEDHGIGIPKEMREQVFERFVRLPSAELSSQPGTGLGLYISRELARRQGGDLQVVDSEPGRGSTLALRLPLAPAPSSGRQPPRPLWFAGGRG
jgi:signal transduction histidine kinase